MSINVFCILISCNHRLVSGSSQRTGCPRENCELAVNCYRHRKHHWSYCSWLRFRQALDKPSPSLHSMSDLMRCLLVSRLIINCIFKKVLTLHYQTKVILVDNIEYFNFNKFVPFSFFSNCSQHIMLKFYYLFLVRNGLRSHSRSIRRSNFCDPR